jgi:hypothetical protein
LRVLVANRNATLALTEAFTAPGPLTTARDSPVDESSTR